MKHFYLYVVLGLVIAAGIAVTVIGYRNSVTKIDKVTVERELNSFNTDFTNAGFDLGFKLKNAEQDSTVYAYLSDQAGKEYILKTSKIFNDLFIFIQQNNLEDDPEKFGRAVQILSFNFTNQAKVINEMNDNILKNRAIGILKYELSLLDELGQGMEADILQTCKELNL